MSHGKPEVASVFGALDTEVVIDGDAAHAHALREMARSANRLATAGHPLLVAAFDASNDTGETQIIGALTGYAQWGTWQRLLPGPLVVPKLPTIRRIEVQIVGHTVGQVGAQRLSVQVLTTATGLGAANLSRDLTAANVIPIVSANKTLGTGANNGWTLATNPTTAGIPVGPSSTELIELWVQGDGTATLMSEATYGAHNTGTVDSFGFRSFYDASATWNVTGDKVGDNLLHYLVFLDASTGATLSIHRPRVRAGNQTVMDFLPEVDPAVTNAMDGQGVTYEIRNLNIWRVAGISIYGVDADAR